MSTSRKSRFGPRPAAAAAQQPGFTPEGGEVPVIAPDLSTSLRNLELELSTRLAQQDLVLETVSKKIDEFRSGQESDVKKMVESMATILQSIRQAPASGSGKNEPGPGQLDPGSVLLSIRKSMDVLANEFSRVASDLATVKTQSQNDIQVSDLAEARQELAVARHELAELTRRLFAVQDDNQWLELELQEKYLELSKLALLVEPASGAKTAPALSSIEEPVRQDSLAASQAASPVMPTWSLGRVLRRSLGADSKLKKSNSKLKLQAQLIADSGLFDAKWYSDKYLTNLEDRGAPIEHYLIVGAKEGFDPGASFCTRWYLDRYPDVAASKMNPLVHYIQHGMTEGREPLPR